MSKLDNAKMILIALQVPSKQQSDLCCYVLLAMAGIKKRSKWETATNEWLRIHDVITFIKDNYKITYAENSRETIRKQAMHHFRNAAFIEDNGTSTNSPNYRYRLTDEMLALIRSFGSKAWDEALSRFLSEHETLVEQYSSKRSFRKIPVHINGQVLNFSPGPHNQLQKAIIEVFAPRFAPNTDCLYIGDTTEKDLVKDEFKLKQLGFEITLHDSMPDVVLYSAEKDWLYFIEAVTSVGPIDPFRLNDLNKLTHSVNSGKIFITAFPDYKTFMKFSASLAWETEVWIAEIPDHMIHLNGDRFIGPR